MGREVEVEDLVKGRERNGDGGEEDELLLVLLLWFQVNKNRGFENFEFFVRVQVVE